MTRPTSTSGFLDKTKRIAATATTIVSILLPSAEEILPSRYYPLRPPFSFGYRWEVKGIYGQPSIGEFTAAEELQIIQEFVTKVVTHSKDLNPRYDQLISENFWELV